MTSKLNRIKAIIFDLDDTLYDCSGTLISNTTEIKNISLFPDVINSINKLRQIGYKLILVTAGVKDMQERKIKVLGLERQFDETVIINNSSGKEGCFKDIVSKYNLNPEQVLCVGDKIKDEIAAGKSLGMFTALIEHGRHYNFYKSNTNEIVPDLHLSNVPDLLKHLAC